jgi:hypothetical protein
MTKKEKPMDMKKFLEDFDAGYNEAFNRGDASGCAAYFSEDVILIGIPHLERPFRDDDGPRPLDTHPPGMSVWLFAPGALLSGLGTAEDRCSRPDPLVAGTPRLSILCASRRDWVMPGQPLV